MALPPPDPDDPPERLLAYARALHEAYEARGAVIEGMRAYVRPWMKDKRMHILGEMFLREIDRLEKAADERTKA